MTPPRNTPRAGAMIDPTRDPVRELQGAVSKLAKIEQQRDIALEERARAIRALSDREGMSVRAIAELAGLSFQRVQQIVDPDGYTASLERSREPAPAPEPVDPAHGPGVRAAARKRAPRKPAAAAKQAGK